MKLKVRVLKEANEGCEYCNRYRGSSLVTAQNDVTNYIDTDINGSLTVGIAVAIEDNKLTIDSDIDGLPFAEGGVKINYCPMCGRTL